MADDADFAAEMAERERQALIEPHRRRQPPPAPAPRRTPVDLREMMDDPREGR